MTLVLIVILLTTPLAYSSDTTISLTIPEAKQADVLEMLQNFRNYSDYWEEAESVLPEGTLVQKAKYCIIHKILHDMDRYFNDKKRMSVSLYDSENSLR